MGVKGLVRDVIMFLVGIQLLMGSTDTVLLGGILLLSAAIFTVIGFLRMTEHV